MRLLILTEKVNELDPSLGFFHAWLEHLAERCERIDVVCTQQGEHHLPGNVFIHTIPGGSSRAGFVFGLYRILLRLRGQYDAVFIHRTLDYVVFAGWWWRLIGKRMVLWYEYRNVTISLRINVFFVHSIATSAKEALGISSKKVRVIGHAIDTGYFSPNALPAHAGLRLLCVGRVAPPKRIEMIIDTLAIMRERGIDAQLTIVGAPISAVDHEYAQKLLGLIAKYSLESQVYIVNSAPYKDLAAYYRGSDFYVNLMLAGGLDKAAMESMACGTPAIVANSAFSELLGAIAPRLIVTEENTQDLAHRIMEISHADDLAGIRRTVRERVIDAANLSSFTNRLLALIAV